MCQLGLDVKAGLRVAAIHLVQRQPSRLLALVCGAIDGDCVRAAAPTEQIRVEQLNSILVQLCGDNEASQWAAHAGYQSRAR